MGACPQRVRLSSPARARVFIRRKHLGYLVQHFVVLHGDGTTIPGPVVVDGAHQGTPGLSLQLDKYAGDVLIFVEGQDDPTLDEVEIAVEAAGILELDLDRHLRMSRRGLADSTI